MENVVIGVGQSYFTATKSWPNSPPQIPTPILKSVSFKLTLKSNAFFCECQCPTPSRREGRKQEKNIKKGRYDGFTAANSSIREIIWMNISMHSCFTGLPLIERIAWTDLRPAAAVSECIRHIPNIYSAKQFYILSPLIMPSISYSYLWHATFVPYSCRPARICRLSWRVQILLFLPALVTWRQELYGIVVFV